MIIPAELAKHGCNTKGVVHIGSNDGGEISYYFDLGIDNIVCFDPLPSAGAELLGQYGTDARVKFVPIAFGRDQYFDQITVTTQHGQQSTFLEVINERVAYGEFSPSYRLTVPVFRFDYFMQEAPGQMRESIKAANCLVIDVQGMELNVLEGMGEWVNHFDHGGVECSGVPVYEGEAPESEVAEFLQARGFQVLNSVGEHGDLLFRRTS